MAIKSITQKFVDSLPLLHPKQKQVIMRDSQLKGFGIRLTPGGASFIVEARVNGKNKRLTLGRTDLLSVETARKEAIKMLAQMTTGADPMEKRKKQEASLITVGEVLDHYLDAQRLKPSTREGYRRKSLDGFKDWLEKPLASVTPAMVLARHKELVRPTKFKTMNLSVANMAMQMLRMLVNYAVNNLGVEMKNPVEIMNKNRAWYRTNRAKAVVADHQMPAYWQIVSKLKRSTVRHFFLLILLTGLRRSEAAELRWEDVDFENRTLTITASRAKNHHEHILPLSDVLFALLSQRKTETGSSPWVFPRKDPSQPISHQTYSSLKIGKEIGCNFSPHAARRTFVTLASRLGIPHHIVKKLVNHVQQVDIASTYIILGIECLREPMQQITDRLMELMELDPAEVFPELTRRPIKVPTLAQVLRDYLQKRKLRSSTRINYAKSMRVDLGDWLDLPVTKITEKMVEARKQALLKRKGDVTVNLTLGTLRSLLNFAAQNYETQSGKKLIEKNPVQNLPRYAESNYRQSYIKDEQLSAWYAALQKTDWEVSRDFLLFVMLTGMRMREAMTLRWSDVDLYADCINVRAEVCKNGRRYTLPLSKFLIEFLQKRKAACGEAFFVFPGRAGIEGHLRSCQRVVDMVCRETAEKFVLPDLRRTFFRAGMEAGISAHVIQRLVNQVGTRGSFAFENVELGQLREAMEKITERLLRLMGFAEVRAATRATHV